MEAPAEPGPSRLEARVCAVTRRAPLLALAAALLVGAAHGTHVYLLDGGLRDFDATAEANLLTWLAVVAAAAGALAAGLHALLLSERRGLMAAVAAGLAYLSLDDATLLHERLGDRLAGALDAGDSITSILQLLAVAPILAAVLAGALLVARDAFPEARRALLAGLACLVAAVLVEQFAGPVTEHVAERGTGWPDELRIAIEEGAELAGVILLAAGLLALLCIRLIAAARDG